MVRAVVWKELREQWLIAIMLAVLGGGLMVAAAMFADPPVSNAPPTDIVASLGAGRLLTLMLVVTAGMVCGGALFAAEREAGTMAYLDALPSSRRALWRAKLAAGLVLAAVEVALLMGTAAALGLADGPFLRRLVIYAVLAFAWGMFGSTLARTTLGSVGIAIPAATLAAFAFLLPIYLFFTRPGTNVPRAAGWVLFESLMVVTPLALSAWRFTALDRLRAADGAERGARPAPAGAGRAPRPAGWALGALAWLTLRQMRLPGAVLSAFALLFGLALLLPELRAVFVWPVLALSAGVLAGVTAFADEQSHQTGPFWGEHRLPVGRAWCVKVSLHLGLLAWLLLLLALPCLVRAQLEPRTRFAFGQTALAMAFHSRLFDELGSQGWKFLVAPAAYGFAFGHLCGLLFRKLVVACGVAAVLGGLGVAVWVPSLLAGGIRHWQLWVPAALVLATGRFLIRPWATDRVAERGALLRLAAGAVAAVLAVSAGIGYRVLEIRDDPGGEDDIAFVASLPTYDENVGGREFRMAAERYARAAGQVQEAMRVPDARRRPRLDERLEGAVRGGWPKEKEDAELDAWLERVHAEPPVGPGEPRWTELAATAAQRPVGVYDHPQMASTIAAGAAALDSAWRMSHALLGRGLQLQVRGDHAAFVPAFRTVVALARTLRNGGRLAALEVGLEVERIALQATERWLERLPPAHVGQTRALAGAAAEFDDRTPFDLLPHTLADRFVIRGLMQAPSQWLAIALAPTGWQPDQAAAEADLVGFAWAVAWERERTRRLVGRYPDDLRPDREGLLIGRPGSPLLHGRNRSGADLADREAYIRAIRRAAILKCAVRAFQGERGSPPGSPEELVSGGYLARLPEDPYAQGRRFGYRVSQGETLRSLPRLSGPGGPREEFNELPVDPGRVIVWSVGVDRADQGGRVPPGGPRAQDLVFLVPPPAVSTP